MPANRAYQLLLGADDREKRGNKGKTRGSWWIICESITAQINSTMWLIWPRWTPTSRVIRVVQKPAEFRGEDRVPALPQHPLIIKGLASPLSITAGSRGRMPAYRLRVAQ